MISGMRVRRRSAFRPGGEGYRYYRLRVTQTYDTGVNLWRVINVWLHGDNMPANGIPSGPVFSSLDPDVDTSPLWDGSTGFGDGLTAQYETHPPPQWSAIDLGERRTLTHYRVRAAHRPSGSSSWVADGPRAWQLQGSNNGTTWDTLDEQTGQTFALNGTTREYTLEES